MASWQFDHFNYVEATKSDAADSMGTDVRVSLNDSAGTDIHIHLNQYDELIPSFYLFMTYYTLDYLSKRDNYFSYSSCLKSPPSTSPPWEEWKDSFSNNTADNTERFYRLPSTGSPDKGATNKISAYCKAYCNPEKLDLYPVGKFPSMDTPRASSYFLNEFQYPVALNMVQSHIPAKTFQIMKDKLTTDDPGKKRKAVKVFLDELYRRYFEIIGSSIKKNKMHRRYCEFL